MAAAALGSMADDFVNKALYPLEKPVFFLDMVGKAPWYQTIGMGARQVRDQHIVNKRMYINPEIENRYISPGIQSVFTDAFAGILNDQGSHCAPLEIKALECIEYYGKQRGYLICKDAYDDFVECKNLNLSKLRYEAIQYEYRKRYWRQQRGQLSDAEKEEIEKNNGYVWRDVPQGNVTGTPLKSREHTPTSPHPTNW